MELVSDSQLKKIRVFQKIKTYLNEKKTNVNLVNIAYVVQNEMRAELNRLCQHRCHICLFVHFFHPHYFIKKKPKAHIYSTQFKKMFPEKCVFILQF